MHLKKQNIYLIMIIFVLLFTGCTNLQDNEAINPKKVLTEEEAIEIEERFFHMLLNQEIIEETYEIKNYQSKDALIDSISEIANRGLVTEFIDEFYTEENDKLYVIPKSGPAKIISNSPYDFNQIDENTYELIQDEEDMLRGAYRLVVTFTNIDNEWKIQDRSIELEE